MPHLTHILTVTLTLTLTTLTTLLTTPHPPNPPNPPNPVDPTDPDSLLAHADTPNLDHHLAYLIRALDATERLVTDDEKARQAAARAIDARIGAADRPSKGLRGALERYHVELGEVLRLYGRNPARTRNALEVAGRILAFDPEHGTANQVLEALLADASEETRREAARALARRDLRRTRAFKAAWAAKHADWTEPGVARTDGYFVRSTIGFSAVERAANALEQISHFYRSFYGVRPDGNQYGRTKVWLYRTRAEFDAMAPGTSMTSRPEVRGFLQTSFEKNLPSFGLYSYDPLDDGMARGNLWTTLFHEASHQYMALAAGAGSPAWLNEGMACLFEGAFLDRRGEVQVGLPAARRLAHLATLLDGDLLSRALRSTDGLDGELYPVAWGLVYHLQYAQDEEGNWPHREALRRAIELSRKRSGVPYAVFEEAVLAPAGLEYAAFRASWERWIVELVRRERDPVAAAEWHRERARRFEQAGRLEAADEAWQQVAMRAPDDARAKLGRARVAAAGDDEDVALLLARRALAEAERVDDLETAAEAEALAQEIDRAGFARLRKAERKYRDFVRAQVRRHLEERRPKTAYAIAERFLDRVLGETHAATVARTVGRGKDHPLSRVVAPFDGATTVGLVCPPEVFRVEEGTLVGTPKDRPAAVFVEEPSAPSFRLEGELLAGDVDSVVAFLVTFPGSLETAGLVVRPKGGIAKRRPPRPFRDLDLGVVAPIHRGGQRARSAFLATDDFEIDAAAAAFAPLDAGEWTRFALDLDEEGHLELTIGGTAAGAIDVAPSSDDVSVGFLIASGEARLRELRLVERGRL